MKNKTKNSKKQVTTSSNSIIYAADKQTLHDFKTATLMVSGFINLYLLVGWMVLQYTTQFDAEVTTLLFK